MSDFAVNCPTAPPVRRAVLRLAASPRRAALHLVGIAALTLVLATGDAFGSHDLPFGRRALMFGVVSALLVIQASLLAEAARRPSRPSFLGMAGACLAVMTMTLALLTVEIHLLKATPVIPYAPDPLPGFALFLMPFVVPASGLVLALKWSAPPERTQPPSRVTGSRPAATDPMKDWPAHAVRRVQALDHYLKLWTPQGTTLVHGRMRDALRRLPAGVGLQPHRSWWLARSEIIRMERRGRDHILLLRNGDRVPVARARAGDVKRRLAGAGPSDRLDEDRDHGRAAPRPSES